MAKPFHIPTSTVEDSNFSKALTALIFCFFCLLVYSHPSVCDLIIILTCISLMTNDYIFMCFLGICISFLEKCVSKFYAHFKVDFLIFFCYCVMSFFFILDTIVLSDIWFVNHLLMYMVCKWFFLILCIFFKPLLLYIVFKFNEDLLIYLLLMLNGDIVKSKIMKRLKLLF